jgi:dihydrofolate synthase/folylpolyglutamate synthase
MDLAAWLEKIQQVHPKDWDLGLDRVGKVGHRLDVLKPAPLVFLVAGTNGKGSTCEFLAGYCRSLNLRYGKTTSPFLNHYNEQIVVDGVPVSDEIIVEAFAEIDRVRGDISLSYFEFGALAALMIFKSAAVDVAILEIGLGGRLDAMNIVDPDVSIITKFAFDHQDWLGDSRELIAIEKAGVMRANKPVVLVDLDPPESLLSEATRQGALASFIQRDFYWREQRLEVDDQIWLLPETQLPMQSAIAATLGMTKAGYELTQSLVSQVLSEASLPGRLQHVSNAPTIILDVAHNPDAAEYLFKQLEKLGITDVQAVVGLFKDKDIAGVFQHLAPLIDGWHLLGLPEERGASSDQLAGVLSDSCGLSGKTYDKVGYALESAKEAAGAEGTVLVFGSFVTVAAVLKYLET